MRTAVFVSGRGSNLKAFLDENSDAETFVFSNKKEEPDAFKWARRRGVKTELVELLSDQDWSDLAEKLNHFRIRQVYLLGFMKIVPTVFLDKVNAVCINLHPSILPDFPGLKSIQRTFESEEAMGCSVHEVFPEVDSGRIFLQKGVSAPFKILSKYTEQVHQAEQDAVGKFIDLNPNHMEAI